MTFANPPRASCALLLLALTACSSNSTTSSPPDTQPAAGVRQTPVVAGRRARVFVMAGFDEACGSLPAPDIAVTQQPAKGSVSFEPGQQTTINTSASGTCIGRTVKGTGIYYTARPGETGRDTFAIEAELGGSVTPRIFEVEIVD